MRLLGTKLGSISTGRGLGDSLYDNAGASPSLDQRFAESKSLTDAVTGQNLITFTRQTSGTYVDSQGVIRNAVTNLLLRSEEFDNASWAKYAGTVSANSIASPANAITADTFVEDTSNALHRISRGGAVVSGSTYTTSVYARYAGRFLYFNCNAIHAARATFDLQSGTVATVGAGSAAIVAMGNGWYRCSVTGVAAATATEAFYLQLNDTSVAADRTYTGDGTSGIYLWGAQLEQSATVGEYIPTTGTTNSAPRFDHNPTTGESLGLLVEEQRTNLVLNSADVSQWQAINSVVVNTNQVTAPDGTLTGDGVTAALTNSNVTQQVTITSSTNTYTVSCFVRNNNAASSRIDGYVRAGSIINVSAGVTVDWNALTATGTGAAANVRLTPYLNGWYQLSYSIVDNNAASDNLRIQFFPDIITGNKQIYLWGLQYEQGAFPTSYIPTTTAAATRAADVASITGSNFSSWYRQDEGTVFASGQSLSTNRVLLAIDDGSMSNRYQMTIAGGYTPNFAAVSGGSVSADIYTAALSQGATANIAAAYRVNDFALSSNGSNSSIDTVGILPASPSIAMVGVYQNGSGYLNGHIRRLTYWPQRLPNATLQTITL